MRAWTTAQSTQDSGIDVSASSTNPPGAVRYIHAMVCPGPRVDWFDSFVLCGCFAACVRVRVQRCDTDDARKSCINRYN